MITTIIKKIYRRFKLVNMPLFVSVYVFKNYQKPKPIYKAKVHQTCK